MMYHRPVYVKDVRMQRARGLTETLFTRILDVLPEDFASLLVLYLKRKRLKYAEFSGLIGRSKNYTAGLVNGRHAPPLEDLKKWSKVLGLNEEEWKQFEEEAWLAHCPHPLVERYRAMKKQLDVSS
jgi:transcriptional regulator with XRE-family HTH domain